MRDLGRLTVNVVQKIASATGTSAVMGAKKGGYLGGLIPPAGLKPSTYTYRATQAISGATGSLDKWRRRENAALDLNDFLRKPSAAGAQQLLGGDFGAMLKGGKAARFAPIITTGISAIAKLGAFASVAGLALGVMVAGIKKAAQAIAAFTEKVGEYSGRISAAKAMADVERETAKLRAPKGLAGIAGAEFERAMGGLEASFTRFQAAITPILTTFVIPAMRALELVVDTLSWIFEMVNKWFGTITLILGTVIAAIGVALMATLNPVGLVVGAALAGIGAGVIYMGQKLSQIDKNTRPKDDFTDANAPFLNDLRLMGARI